MIVKELEQSADVQIRLSVWRKSSGFEGKERTLFIWTWTTRERSLWRWPVLIDSFY
jgi:hypothetical protein